MRYMYLLIGLFLVGCASVPKRQIGEEWLIESSGNKSGWITKIPETKGGVIYFRGIKTHAPTLDGGLTDARQHAARQVAEMVENQVNVDYERARVEYGIPRDDEEIGSVTRDLTIALSDAVTQGVKEKESYWERWSEQLATGIGYFFNVYTLVTLTEEDYKRIANQVFEEKIEKARAENNKKAEEALDKFRKEVMQRRFEEGQ